MDVPDPADPQVYPLSPGWPIQGDQEALRIESKGYINRIRFEEKAVAVGYQRDPDPVPEPESQIECRFQTPKPPPRMTT